MLSGPEYEQGREAISLQGLRDAVAAISAPIDDGAASLVKVACLVLAKTEPDQ
jgi:hypothetical protein